MPKRFYKHKTLLDEHLCHRRVYPLGDFYEKFYRDNEALRG